MRPKITIGLLCIAAVLAWTGVAGAQAAPPTPKLQLPSGETVWDLSGDWDAFVENYGPWARFGIYPTAWRITQTGSTVRAIRAKANPAPSPGAAGSPSLQGELDKDGFKRVAIVSGVGTTMPCKGQIREDGKKIVLDDAITAKVTLTRSADRTPLVGLWRLVAFQREYEETREREYPFGSLPSGYIQFSPEGRMTVVITGTREDRKAPTSVQERANLFDTLVAYTGPYRVDGATWITTVEVAANPARVGSEQARTFEISGDLLQEMTAYAAQPDNRKARFVITYERMK